MSFPLRLTILFATVATVATVAAGCGGGTATSASSASTSSSGGGSTSTSASSGTTGSSTSGSGTGGSTGATTGTGGAGGSGGTSTSGTTTSGTTGSGGAGVCTKGSITIEGDGATRTFDFACPGSYGATYTAAAYGYIGAEPHSMLPEQLYIDGCLDATGASSAGSLAINTAQTTVGSTTMGAATYLDGADTYTTLSTVSLTVTEIDPPGGFVKGTYTTTVTDANDAMKTLKGSFSVCAVMAFLPP